MSEPEGALLITGVTGFIGREVLGRALATEREVFALARAKRGESPAARLERMIGDPMTSRVTVVEGDLARPGSGLDRAVVVRLRSSVETIIHCAGEPTFFPESPTAFRAAHVDGPRELLETLAGGRLRRWAHLSTAYVCGVRSGTMFEWEGQVGQRFRNPYEEVKLEAETVLRAAGQQGAVDVRIVRPSIVVGRAPSTAGGSPTHLLFGLMRMAAALAGSPDGAETPVRISLSPQVPLNIVPVEYVADATAALAEHPDAAGQTLHLVAPDPPTIGTLVEMLCARFGLQRVRLLDPGAGPIKEPSSLEAVVERMLEPYRPYLEADQRFDDTRARRILDACGIPAPRFTLATLNRFIDEALEVVGQGTGARRSPTRGVVNRRPGSGARRILP